MYRLTQIHGPVCADITIGRARWSTGNTECSLAFDQVRLASAIRQDVEAAQRAVALRQQPGTHTPWVETVPTRQLPQPARLSLLFQAVKANSADVIGRVRPGDVGLDRGATA